MGVTSGVGEKEGRRALERAFISLWIMDASYSISCRVADVSFCAAEELCHDCETVWDLPRWWICSATMLSYMAMLGRGSELNGVAKKHSTIGFRLGIFKTKND